MQDHPYTEGQRLQGSDGNVYVVHNGVPTRESGASSVVAPNPAKVAQAQAEAARAAASDAREAARFAERNKPTLPAGYRFSPDGVSAERIAGLPAAGADDPASIKESAATRATAIGGYKAAQQLEATIAEIERLYKEGPGSTKGLFGLWDYAPTEANSRFNKAADAARGVVIQALGFTSGQTNTPREVEMNIGGYIPSAGSYDATIEDTIERLKQLRIMARDKAIATLGGVPDDSGRVTPVDKLTPEQRKAVFGESSDGKGRTDNFGVPMLNVGGGQDIQFGGDGPGPATGKRYTPQQEAQIAQAVRDGDLGQVISLSQKFSGNPPTEESIAGARSAIEAVRKNPNAQIMIPYGAVDEAVQSEAERKQFGDHLVPAMRDRAGASGLDVGVRSGVNGLTAGLADYASAAAGMMGGGSFADNLQRQQAITEADARISPRNSMISGIVGGAAGAALTEGAAGALLPARAAAWAPRVGDALYGATAGATSAAPGEGGAGAMSGGMLGTIGGMAGRNVTRGVGRVIGGARNASADYLRGRGVPLTMGQLLGNGGRVGQAIKGIEDRLTGIPGVGNMVNARRLEGLEGFNRAGFREGLDSIGMRPTDIAEQGVEQGQQAVSDAYSGALRGVNAVPDPQFNAEFGAARAAGQSIPRTGPEFDHVIGQRIDPHLEGGSFDGPAIQDALQGLRRANFGNDAMGSAASDAAGNVEDALTGLVSRQAPGVMPQLGAANTAYRNLTVLADAVGKSANSGGVFTPAKLNMAARANATKFTGKMNAATTRRPFFDLARAGQDVLPSQVPDSGTGGRMAMLALPSALGGAGAGLGYAGGDAQSGAGTGLALGALLAAGGTRAGQRALASLFADRPDSLVRIANQINRRARVGGIFGAPMLANSGALQAQ